MAKIINIATGQELTKEDMMHVDPLMIFNHLVNLEEQLNAQGFHEAADKIHDVGSALFTALTGERPNAS